MGYFILGIVVGSLITLLIIWLVVMNVTKADDLIISRRENGD